MKRYFSYLFLWILITLSSCTSKLTNIGIVYPLQSGQTKSYVKGDDGDLKHGRLSDFFTLKSNNAFGNKSRFTDENGLQIYASDYIIDNATGLGWYRVAQTPTTWDSAVRRSRKVVVKTSVGTFDNFFLPNWEEIVSLYNWQNVSGEVLGYIPISIAGTSTKHWTSTTCMNPIFRAVGFAPNSIGQTVLIDKEKVTCPYYVCRVHFES
jgi:hypothetical protein